MTAPPTTLLSFLVEHTPLSGDFLRVLGAFGAIWAKIGDDHPHVSPRPVRVDGDRDLDRVLPLGVRLYARVHAVPRRHRSAWPVELLATHVTESGTAYFVDKPAGVPVGPSSDNVRECVLSEVNELIGTSVRITSRLDVGTSGVLVLGDSREVVSRVNASLRDGKCTKMYAVLTRGRPACQTLRHWVRQNAPRGRGGMKMALVREWNGGTEPEDDKGGWCHAELVVESVESLWDGGAWESIVRLVTGRTHQIRIQYAAEGHHVYDDSTYAAVGGNGRIDAGGRLGPYAERHGLHAMKLSIQLDGSVMSIEAGLPWWRR